MKKYIHSLFILLLVISSNESLGNEKEKFVNDLISKMTLEEKVGQRHKLILQLLLRDQTDFHRPFQWKLMIVEQIRHWLISK